MRFLSFPSKILLLTLVLMLVLIVLLTSLSLQRLDESFATQQAFKQQQVKQHFEQYQQILRNKQQSWFDSYTDLTALAEQQGFSVFAEQLASRYDNLSMYLNLEGLWFFVAENTEPLFSSAPFPPSLQTMVATTLQQQKPVARIYCAAQCSNVMTLPLSDIEGRMAVLLLSQTLADVVIAMGQALQSEVLIVRQHAAATTILSTTPGIEADTLDSLIQNPLVSGALLPDSPFYLYQLPLSQQQDVRYSLVLLENIQTFLQAKQRFRWQMILLAMSCFLLFAGLTYWLTRRLSQRLLQVADALPLLADRQFTLFRQTLPTESPLLRDEVDRLAGAGEELSRQLEKLQQEIAARTRELQNMAMYDLLTGLANRNMLQFQLKKRIAALQPDGPWLGLLFLDLDQFKKVNDSRGHEQGDKLLIEAAGRLRAALTKTDLLCRFGGDEFVVVTEVRSTGELDLLAIALIDTFRQPMFIGQDRFQLDISIGISCTRDSHLQPDDLVRQADLAMYQAKAGGGCSSHFYSQQMFDAFQNRLALENDLKQALDMQQFDVFLQPKIHLQTQRLVGLEALLRWRSPSRGMVPPDEFIAILEYAQLMIPVGYWVIEQSCRIMQQLQQAGIPPLTLAINLSNAQLNDPGLPPLLNRLLHQYQLQAEQFEFELTENILVNNIESTIASMQIFKQQGFRLAIDDYGTGYATLNYLRQMPVDIIKIDKSFVFGMLDNHADFTIITSTISLVQKLGLEVVAEGVETQAQAKTLQQYGCDIGQGYLFAKPIPQSQLVAELHAQLDEQGCWR